MADRSQPSSRKPGAGTCSDRNTIAVREWVIEAAGAGNVPTRDFGRPVRHDGSLTIEGATRRSSGGNEQMKCDDFCNNQARLLRMHRSSNSSIGKLPSTATIVCLLVLFSPAVMPVHAAVIPIGDVLPADDPFTGAIDEGLPLEGNLVDVNLLPDQQEFWEDNVDIIVGQKLKEGGRLDIDGSSQLRYQDLIIGDQGEVAGVMRLGVGTVLITGVGALYSNDPTSIPAGFPANFGSIADDARDPNIGFDLYVGRFGTGHLEIRGGGRAEIQDAVLVGDQPNSFGSILVDGFASMLSSGAFDSGGGIGQINQMIVGRQGDGSMTISTGGLVISDAQAMGTGQFDTIAAVIGSDPAINSNDEPQPGGRGTVTVTGPTSRWIVGGSLQIGGFQEQPSGAGSMAVEGTELEYNSEAGRGTLNLWDGGVLMLRPAIDADPNNEELRVLIGRFGRVNLNGGTIRMGSVTGTDDGVQDTVQILNDGIIEGDGEIYTGVFRNRYLGEIRVHAGQKLLVDSASEFRSMGTDEEPLSNFGVIQVIGTPESRAEFEIDRAPNTPMDPVQPFRNLPVQTPPAGARAVGQITAAHSTLRFRSGLSNSGKLAFIAGDNFVSGAVTNEAGDPANMVPAGDIAIAGNNTTVTFEDPFVNNGRFDIFPNSSLVLFENDFTQSAGGALALTLGGRPTGNELSFLSIMGDASLAGTLEVDLFGTGANPIDPMDGDVFEILATQGQLSGIFTNLIMPNLGPDLVMFPVYDYAAGTVNLQVAELVPVIGADFDGNGIVDLLDLAILQMNIGITMGALPMQGDADGDGDVDGDDFLVWQQQLGMAPMPGIGSSASQLANVPEPASFALFASALLAMAATRWARR